MSALNYPQNSPPAVTAACSWNSSTCPASPRMARTNPKPWKRPSTRWAPISPSGSRERKTSQPLAGKARPAPGPGSALAGAQAGLVYRHARPANHEYRPGTAARRPREGDPAHVGPGARHQDGENPGRACRARQAPHRGDTGRGVVTAHRRPAYASRRSPGWRRGSPRRRRAAIRRGAHRGPATPRSGSGPVREAGSWWPQRR